MVENEKILIINLKNENSRNTAFQDLVQMYKERLYWHIRKIVLNHDDADDLLQNVFVKVWQNVGSFREDSSLYTWLYRIATNESITFLQQKKRHSQFASDEISGYLVESLEADSFYEGEEIEKKLQLAVATLPERQRIVFNMKYFDEMKYEEISEILQVSVGALKASYHHAVKKVEAFLENEE